ncbi:MAG: hypothetical protein AAF772_14260 [Acidobacteriota bacterium]
MLASSLPSWLPAFLGQADFWRYASIPVVAGLVGWWTNWVAIKLTFAPLEFIGIPPFLGWQGIIPRKAAKMAEIFVDSTMDQLGTLGELFEQMEPARIAAHINAVVGPRLAEYTDEVMRSENAVLWENLPPTVRRQVYREVEAQMPRLVDNLMGEIGERVEELIDFKHMIRSQLVADKALLNKLFLECGHAEFRFLIRSGLYFGFAFGLIQLAVWWFYKGVWVLPVFGLLVGFATNWIAINLIFRPLHPTRIGPFVLQGLFLKRQAEVAVVWCDIVTKEMITIRQIIDQMINGPHAAATRKLIQKHIRPVVDEVVGLGRPVAQLSVGLRGYAELKDQVGDKAVMVSMDPFNHWGFNKERGVIVERLLRQRMVEMPPDQFQNLLRPCFQEDELTLILVGAALGLAAGFAQLFLVFGSYVGG